MYYLYGCLFGVHHTIHHHVFNYVFSILFVPNHSCKENQSNSEDIVFVQGIISLFLYTMINHHFDHSAPPFGRICFSNHQKSYKSKRFTGLQHIVRITCTKNSCHVQSAKVKVLKQCAATAKERLGTNIRQE